MKLLPLLTALFTITSSYSAQSTSALGAAWTKLKESPMSLDYGLIGQTHSDERNTIQGMNLYHDLLLSYDVTANDQLRVTSEFSNPYGRPSAYELTELRYQRSGLANQKAHGVDISFQQRYLANGDTSTTYGHSSTRLLINRSLSNRLALSNIIRYDITHDSSSLAVGDNKLRLYVTPSWSISDQLSTGLTFRYGRTIPQEGSGENSLTVIPGIAYSLANAHSVSASAYIDYDDQSNEIQYELSYSLSVF